MLLQLIYSHKSKHIKNKLVFVPAIFNVILCVASIFNGWIFSINIHNVYKRGPNFTVLKTSKKETRLLILIMI